MTCMRRRISTIAQFGILLGILLSLSPAENASAAAASAAPSEEQERLAAVVIRFSESLEDTFCIALPGRDDPSASQSVSGIEALQMTELPLITKDFGGDLGEGVCKIGPVGTDDCDFERGFWGYYRFAGGSWQFSDVGPGTSEVAPGVVDGWSWTAPGADPVAPAASELSEICAAELAAADEGGLSLPWILALALGGGVVLGASAAGVWRLRRRTRPGEQ